MMARGTASLRFAPPLVAEALRLTLSLSPNTEGAKIAQREIATALETAFDARRQRIIISQSQVNLVKWLCCLFRLLQPYSRLQWSTATIGLPLPSRLACLQLVSPRQCC